MTGPKVQFCPRKGCGGPINLTPGGKIHTHSLPSGWKKCAASGLNMEEAAALEAPKE